MDVLNLLAALDRRLLLLSHQFHTPAVDALMQALSSRWAWAPLLLVLLTLGWRYSWRRVLPGTVAVLVGVGAANGLVGSLVKPWVARPRPCQVPELLDLLHLPHGCRSGFGFPSTHTADVVAVVAIAWLVLPRRFRWLRLALVGWSGAVAYSRVYLGVHYPLDILAGAALGGSCALAAFALVRHSWPAAFAYRSEEPSDSGLPPAVH